jgi:hypothetical protein
MTIDKNLEGAWRICENINGYLETQVYYFSIGNQKVNQTQ